MEVERVSKVDRYDGSIIQHEKRPLDQFKCNCSVCYMAGQRQLRMKIKKLDPLGCDESLLMKSRKVITEKDFVFIMKRLIPPPKLQRGLRLNVMETCCFINGKTKFLVYSQKQKKDLNLGVLKYVLQKEQLTLSQVKQHLRNGKVDSETNQMTTEQNIPKFDIRQKVSVMTESKNGFLKPNQVIIYHDIETVINNHKFQKQNKPENDDNQISDRTTKEAVICMFQDGNSQVLNEIEFANLMLKRNNDPYFEQIQYLQNYPKTSQVRKIKYKQISCSENQHFQRAKTEVLILQGEISRFSEDYISNDKEEDFELNLLQTKQIIKLLSVDEYLRYLSFKIVHFIQSFYGFKIVKAIFEFLKDDQGNYVLFNASEVKWIELPKRKLISEAAPLNPEELISSLQDTTLTRASPQISQLEAVMLEDFYRRKRELGIVIDNFYVPHDTRSDDQFRQLFPNAPAPFTDLIQQNSPTQILNEMWTSHIPTKRNRYLKNVNVKDSGHGLKTIEKSIEKTDQNINDWVFHPYRENQMKTHRPNYKTRKLSHSVNRSTIK